MHFTILWKILWKTDAALDQTFPCFFTSPQFVGLYLWKWLEGEWNKNPFTKTLPVTLQMNFSESQTIGWLWQIWPINLIQSQCKTLLDWNLFRSCLSLACSLYKRTVSLSVCRLVETGVTWVFQLPCLGLRPSLCVLQHLGTWGLELHHSHHSLVLLVKHF